MHLLTTDLDRTIIFSARSINSALEHAICVEELDGREISYMNNASLQLVKSICQQHLFIPVTSRSRAQYERLSWYHLPRYAIVANGGIILKDGTIDLLWAEKIATEMKSIATLQEIEQFLPTNKTLYDTLYFVCQAEQPIDEHTLQQSGWVTYVNGRKRYIMPRFLTKERAVHYLRQQLLYDTHYAAGDSMMDVAMLQLADVAFAPDASEAALLFPKAATLKRGIPFAQYVMEEIQRN